MKTIAVLMLMTAAVFAVRCTPEQSTTSLEVKVSTYTPHDITGTSAICGGYVTVDHGFTFDELGVCWGESVKPSADGFHLSTTNWSEPYACTITGLEPNKTYHVRAYAKRGLEYYYGEDRSFTTMNEPNNGGGNAGSGIYNYNGHDYVDLGLPSGTLWATCNVGAATPEAYGDYFAWGETEPKTTYNWGTYKYCRGSEDRLTKYCSNSDFGYNGFTDNLIVLQLNDDAATANWGSGWRTPTADQWRELYKNTNHSWTSLNGVTGRLFVARNGNRLFLPAAGCIGDSELSNVGSNGYYWSNSLYVDYPFSAWIFGIVSSACGMFHSGVRGEGKTVRPVHSSK